MFEAELGHARGAAADTAGALGEGAVGRVVDEGLEATADGIALGPDDDVFTRLVELLGWAGDAADIGLRIMVDPLRNVAAMLVVIVGGGRTVKRRIVVESSTYRLDVSLGTRGACLVTDNQTRREFFGMLALEENRLLVAHPDIGENSRRVIAEGRVGIADGTRAIEIHAAIELEQDIFC